MTYSLPLTSPSGDQVFHLKGWTKIDMSTAFSPSRMCKSTTALSTEIASRDGSVIASGVLHLGLVDFLRQLDSMRAVAASDKERRTALIDFFASFSRMLAKHFFGPLLPLEYPPDHPTPIQLSKPSDMEKTIVAADGCETVLRMWQPEGLNTKQVRDILFIPGAAVTHDIFALSTSRQSAIDYFTSAGYRCWCVTIRIGKQEKPHQRLPWTAYDARLDILAALNEIQRFNGTTGSSCPPYVIAHCAGSIALASGLLDSTIPSHSIAGVTASNVFMHPILAPMSKFKARLPLLQLYRLVAGSWFSCDSRRTDSWIQRTLNELLRFRPRSSRKELCNSVACLRSQLAFGRLWSHQNLSEATQANLHNILGGVHTSCLQQFVDAGLKGVVNDHEGRSLVNKANLRRLENLPVFLFFGADSAVYTEEGTRRSFEVLAKRSTGQTVKRKVFEGLGHVDCWMSDKASEKGGVFDSVLDEIEQVRGS
jgi:hypothetical protein